MASVAAVAANIARSPPQNDLGYDDGKPGEVTSAIGSKEDNGVVELGEEDDVRGFARRKGVVETVGDGDPDEEDGEKTGGVEDLFGDEEEEPEKTTRRQLDDEELDSGDDVDRADRVAEEPQATQEQEYETQEKVMMDMEMARQPVPEPSDGEVWLHSA